MKIKELFKMVENYNKLNAILGSQEQKRIELTYNGDDSFLTYNEFKKFCKYEFIDELIKIIETSIFIQDDRHLNIFKAEKRTQIVISII